jgi:hypothetical protein
MPFIWVILAFIILLLLQRWIHTHLHGLSLLLTGKPERAVYLYALVLFPGVLLHELSHWLTATLLGIRTGKFSLLPQRQKDGSITLGYVEYYKDSGLGPIRESLVGGAPLLTGTAVILLISYTVLDVTRLAEAVQTGHIDNLYLALDELLATPYFFLWLYLLFAIGNAMMPSPSDRRAWPAFLGITAVLILALYLLGFTEALLDGLAGPVTIAFSYLGIAFAIVIVVDLIFMAFIALLEKVIGRIRGVSVVYNGSVPRKN